MWKFTLFIFLLPISASGEEVKYLNQWGGIDVYHDSSKIADSDASDLANVLTDRGFLEKRPGSSLFQTIDSSAPILYIFEYVSPSKTRYMVVHTSAGVYQTDTSASFSLLQNTDPNYNIDCVSAFGKMYCVNGIDTSWWWNGVSTGVATNMPTCRFIEFADERLYCANTVEGGDSQINASEYGDLTNWTVPTTNLTASDPMSWTIQRTDGEGITCFKSTPWGKFIGKRHSTHILKGYDNSTYYKRIIDPNIGCVDDRSVQMVDGVLMWVGLEGVYAWEGSGSPVLVSQDIDSYMKDIRQILSNKASWLLSTQADFESGNLEVSGPGAKVSSTVKPGSITPSSWTHTATTSADFGAGQKFINISTSLPNDSVTLSTTNGSNNNIPGPFTIYDDFIDGNYTDNPTWTVATGNWEVINQELVHNSPYAAEQGRIYTVSTHTTGVWQFIYKMDDLLPYNETYLYFYFMSTTSNYSGNGYILRIERLIDGKKYYILERNDGGTRYVLNGYSTSEFSDKYETITLTRSSTGYMEVWCGENLFVATDNTYTTSSYFFIYSRIADSSYPNHIYAISFPGPQRTGRFVSQVFDTTLSTPTGGLFNVTDTKPAGTGLSFEVRDSTDGSNWGSWTSLVEGNQIPLNKRYWQYRANFSTNYSTQTPQLDDVTLTARTTCEYYSPVKYIGNNISKWLTFDSNESLNGGTISYWVRTSSNSFTINSATPAWVAQTNHIEVSTTANAWFQWRAYFNPVNGDNEVAINDVTVNWQEGTSQPMASLGYDHRYHLCVMQSSTTLVNDVCWIFQKNKKWTKFTGPNYSSLSLYNNEPIAGDNNETGKIYKIMQDGVWNDDGNAIISYWNTGDFTMGSPGFQKVFKEMWIDAGYESGSKLDVGYAMNKSSVWTSTNTALDSQDNYVCKRVDNLPDGYALGRYLKFQFGNSELDKYFKLNSATIFYDIEPLKPD